MPSPQSSIETRYMINALTISSQSILAMVLNYSHMPMPAQELLFLLHFVFLNITERNSYNIAVNISSLLHEFISNEWNLESVYNE